MKIHASPRDIVDRHLRSYNAHDIDAYCALYAADAVISTLTDGKEVARGTDMIRRLYAQAFKQKPDLNYSIRSRIELGAFVIDYELLSGAEDTALEVVAIYEVRESLIRTVRFLWP
jgi:hypothetical protein